MLPALVIVSETILLMYVGAAVLSFLPAATTWVWRVWDACQLCLPPAGYSTLGGTLMVVRFDNQHAGVGDVMRYVFADAAEPDHAANGPDDKPHLRTSASLVVKGGQ
eukprot:503939-Prorocentrum_minimum.AAC.2